LNHFGEGVTGLSYYYMRIMGSRMQQQCKEAGKSTCISPQEATSLKVWLM
jgi:hypothetical protein